MAGAATTAPDPNDPAVARITWTGVMDENFVFPEPNISEFRELVLDLNGIESINSLGIRAWIDWITPVSEAKTLIRFINVPTSMVLQFNMIEGFFPKMGVIDSLYIPFYCDKCDCNLNALWDTSSVSSSHVPGDYMHSIRDGFCQKEACALEPEYAPRKYLSFLSRAFSREEDK